MSHQKQAVQIDVNHLTPVFERQLLNRHTVVGNSGIVDEHIEMMKSTLDRNRQFLHRHRVAHIASAGENLRSLSAELPLHFLERGRIASRDHERAPLGSESAGEGQSNAAGGSSDECDFAAETLFWL